MIGVEQNLDESGVGRAPSRSSPWESDQDHMTSPATTRKASEALEQIRRFEAIARRLRQPLLQYFRKRGLDDADAEDLTQTALLRLLHKMRGEPETPTDGYVFTIASTVIIDHYRRQSVRHQGATVEIDPETPCSEPLADKILEDRQNLRNMLEVIEKMRPKLRKAFKLHRFSDFSYAEIALRMGISVSSVEKYLMAALSELRDSFDNDVHV